MCNPVAAVAGVGMVASLGLTIAQSRAQYKGQKEAAKAQDTYQKQLKTQREDQMQENYTRAIEAFRFKKMSEQVRLEEVRKAASHQVFNVNQAGLRARSTAAAQAASRGSAGQSLYTSLLDYIAQSGFAVGGINEQYRAEQGQSYRNVQAFGHEAKARMSSVQPYIPAPVQYPSAAGSALQIGAGALNSFNTYGQPFMDMMSANTTSPALIQPNATTGTIGAI